MKDLSDLENSRNKFLIAHKELQDRLVFIHNKKINTIRYKILKLFGITIPLPK